jgi:hypothetical protein
MPDLVTVTADVVLPRTISFGASDDIDVDSTEIGGSKQCDVGDGVGEDEGVSIVVEDELVDDHMSDRDAKGDAEPSVHPSFVGLISGFVDPLEETDDETEGGHDDDSDHVDNGHFQLAVHAVVERREYAS